MRASHLFFAFAVASSLIPRHTYSQDTRTVRQAGDKTRATTSKKNPTCQVDGVWQLESANWGGSESPMTGVRQRKILTKNHFMFISADAKRDTITLRTAADSLRALQIIGGTGTYTVNGNTYTEHLELFFIPNWEGRDVPAKCETMGDKWIHTWKYDTVTVVEVWRRISK